MAHEFGTIGLFAAKHVSEHSRLRLKRVQLAVRTNLGVEASNSPKNVSRANGRINVEGWLCIILLGG